MNLLHFSKTTPKNAPPLTAECAKLVSLGHTPQNVVMLARSLNFIELLRVAFPSAPPWVVTDLYTGDVSLVCNKYGEWELIRKET